MFYRIRENKLYDFADYMYATDCLETDIITQEELNGCQNKVIVVDGVLALNPNYEEEKAQEERERVAMLSLTRGDIFRGLLSARGVTRAQIRTMIEEREGLTELEREMALIDFDEALNFYRGNSMINIIGEALGITPEQLDKFFESGNYEELGGRG